MNIRDLQYLVEVEKQKNFTRAAEAVFVSQSALSHQIKKLEGELNVQIFERKNNDFLVTPPGKLIIEKARQILHKVDDIKNIAKISQNQFAGEFKIGAFPTLAPYYFPQIASEISKKFKDLKLFLVEEKTETLIKKLKNGELDAAFLADPVDEIDLKKDNIFEEKFLLMISQENNLAGQKIIDFKDLKGKEMMLLQEGHCMRSQALSVCEIAGVSENSDYRASSLETLRQMVKINRGITLVPEIAATKDKKIIYLDIKNAPTRKISLFWRENYYREDLIKEISKIAKK